jgi:phosphoribosyl 1,2-cyclic phosphodiesterase
VEASPVPAFDRTLRRQYILRRVRCGDRLIIFDGGTGLRPLGDSLMKSGAPIDADILLSHCHIDHVNGVPFFAPFFASGIRSGSGPAICCRISIWRRHCEA